MLFPQRKTPDRPTRVVITGVGIITAHGNDWDSNAEGFRLGRLAIKPVTLFDVSRQRVQVAAEAGLPDELPSSNLPARESRRLDRAGRLLLHAAHEAWQQSRWTPEGQLPLVLGTTSGGMSLGEAFYRKAMTQSNSQRGQAARVLHYQPQRQALNLAEAFGFRGPISLIANACASGANAIGHAWDMIRSGRSERVFAGGYDALTQLVFSGFDSLQALSPTTCRPFDANRDGLALGEGAAMFALESLTHALHRGASILGEIVGYGAATDTHHLTQPCPAGDAAFAAMSQACACANLPPAKIDYVNAHGTGTPLNDSAESAAINRWADGARIPVSSTKSGIGHLLGAAGAVEVAVCLMALRGQWLPPTLTLKTPDPVCCFPLVSQPAPAHLDYALTNSFGFGGANASLILRRWE